MMSLKTVQGTGFTLGGASDVDFMGWLTKMASDPTTNKFVNLNPKVSETTHYRMDGGKLAIHPILTDVFLQAYANALTNGEVISMVERRTDVYKMHYDLDVLDLQVWNEEKTIDVLREIRLAMAECFPPEKATELFRTVVLTAPPKQVNNMWKTGIHVIYPDLQVDSAMGLTLRKVAVMRLNRRQRRVEPLNAWDDVLDRCVHVANGLRMVGSVKMSKCVQCAAKRKRLKNVGFNQVVLCDSCNGKTMLNDGRAYTAFLLLDSFGNKDVAGTEQLKQNRCACVHLASIRCFSPLGVSRNPDFVLPPGITWEEPSAKDTKGRTNIVVSRKEFRDMDKRQLNGNSALVPLLEQFLTTSPFMSQLAYTTPGNPYKDVFVIKVLYNKSTRAPCYLVNVDGAGSTYCNNKGACHTSSRVYFEFRSKHMVQKCFCAKVAAVEGAVPCSKYSSPKVALPEDLRRLLFPPSPVQVLDVAEDVLRGNVVQNMKSCAVVKKVVNRKKVEAEFLQTCWTDYKKRLDLLEHVNITSSLEPVPLSKETMYPSRVSSALCKLTSEQVETASAAELYRMTESLVMDLKAEGKEPRKNRKRKRSEDGGNNND